jgi:hypothetical protein
MGPIPDATGLFWTPVDRLIADLAALLAEREAPLRKVLKQLRASLRPFAEYADDVTVAAGACGDALWSDNEREGLIVVGGLLLGDFRRARRACARAFALEEAERACEAVVEQDCGTCFGQSAVACLDAIRALRDKR